LAVKIINKYDKDAEKIREEGKILSTLKHPNIINLIKMTEK
jgi:hypothetical protein